MSINKKILFLLFVFGTCAACTKEDVKYVKEKITVSLDWGNKEIPDGMHYYFYKKDDNGSVPPVIIEEGEAIGFETTLTVGAYRFAGYNADVVPNRIEFVTKHNATLVAQIQTVVGDNLKPLSLYAVSDNNLAVIHKDRQVKEFTPVNLQTKTLRLNLEFLGLSVPSEVNGIMRGVFTSWDLSTGKAFADKGYVDFNLKSGVNVVNMRIVDLYLYSGGSALYKNELVLNLVDGNGNKRSGEVRLETLVEELINSNNGTTPSDICFNVAVIASNTDRLILKVSLAAE